jgi:biopolymer transport protein ExbD
MKREIRKTYHSHHGTLNELNITPLLDLVFVLLVIFIITTPQLMNNLEMNLPSGKPKPPSGPKPKLNQLFVDAKGQAYLDREPLSLSLLKDRLQRLKAADPDLGLVVRGADEVDYQNMVNVLDVLQQLQITKVGLATDLGVTGP